MLSKLASRSISLLSKFDNEANKFYDRKHDLYEAALLIRCYSTCSSSFVCVEVLRPSQPNGVMSSAVSLPNHTFTGQV